MTTRPAEEWTFEDVPFGEEPPQGMALEQSTPPSYESIPPGLSEVEPGPVLAGHLAAIDVAKISGFDQIVVLRARQRMVSHYTAAMYADMAAVNTTMLTFDGYPTQPVDAAELAAAEIRVALHLTRRGADIELAFALSLEHRLPRLADMLASGVIDFRRARTIDDSTTHLSDAAARSVIDEIAEIAPELTTGELRARIRNLCITADPDEAKNRYDLSVADRRVVMQATDAGTSNLSGVDLPPDRAVAISRRINAWARGLLRDDEERTMDQLRADIFMDLLDGITPATRRGTDTGVIDLNVDLDTLAGLNDHPGELRGYGPVIADVARRVAEEANNSQWRVSALADTGDNVHIGTTTRRPTAQQRRRIETRNRTCVFPGCRMPAGDCDIDHTTPVADGGVTCDCNLAPLCRHDHRIKHARGWSYDRRSNNRHQWTTPFGHTYTTAPEAPP